MLDWSVVEESHLQESSTTDLTICPGTVGNTVTPATSPISEGLRVLRRTFVLAATSSLPKRPCRLRERCQSARSLKLGEFPQQIDDVLALVASMRGALSHSEGLRAVTVDRERVATSKDHEMMGLKDALLTTHYRKKLPENLERFVRYR